MRHQLNRALVLAAGLLLAAAAAAQSPNAAAPAKANAAPQAQTPPGKQKADDKPDTTGKTDTATKDKDTAAPKAADRAARVKSEHDAERAKLTAILHAPMDDAMRAELKRHGRRIARLERIKALATEAKDTAIADRASKLLEKENARHDKWLTAAAATAQTTPDPKAGAR
jgi:hypothetical protein